jgi:hypothetical protein
MIQSNSISFYLSIGTLFYKLNSAYASPCDHKQTLESYLFIKPNKGIQTLILLRSTHMCEYKYLSQTNPSWQ